MTSAYHENYLFLNGFQNSVICASDSGIIFCDNPLTDTTENILWLFLFFLYVSLRAVSWFKICEISKLKYFGGVDKFKGMAMVRVFNW